MSEPGPSPARDVSRLSRAAVARVRRATHAKGAGESGLAKLIELNGAQAAADALVAVSLAGTLFFSVPTGQARGRVALYLLLTMAPFAVVAPIIGPVLDRFRHGRRYALAATMLARAFAAWYMANALAHHEPLQLYPAAFAILVLSKAYAVSKNAVTPRLLPSGSTLVQANARVGLAGTLSGLSVGALGAAVVATAGPRWSLRLAAVVFIVGMVFALRLPPKIDSAEGELSLRSGATGPIAPPGDSAHPWWANTPVARAARGLGPTVISALRANAALRFFSGFLTIFIAFLVRTHDFGPPPNLALGFFALAAGGAGIVGTITGARARGRSPAVLLFMGLCTVTALSYLAAVAFSLTTVLLIAVGAGIAQTVGKLALDATIQTEVAEEIRTAAFARTETVQQMSFVVGGAFGLLPIAGRLGLLGAGVLLTVVLIDTLRRRALRATS